jgi:endonuclease YncB( thermonuclease family)
MKPLLLAIGLYSAALSSHSLAACNSDHFDSEGIVAYAFDGDTVELVDGRHVRFIGINTPEVGHRGQASQPLADAARAHLMSLLPKGAHVRLRLDQEKNDHYQRLLAHVFTDDGQNINELQLVGGFATTLIVPPNLWQRECYATVERAARDARRGIWALPNYQAISSNSLTISDNGYYIVHGQVTSVRRVRDGIWVNLSGSLGLKIEQADMSYFSVADLSALSGMNVEARGWLHPDKKQLRLRMQIRHPSDLARIDR